MELGFPNSFYFIWKVTAWWSIPMQDTESVLVQFLLPVDRGCGGLDRTDFSQFLLC